MARATLPVDHSRGDSGSGENTFGFDELFFSRTDSGGIIKYGNSVFQRISVYGWEELLSKPHKIVRHPDTPRAVFWVLWKTIKEGKPIGAYVKNRAKDGSYYWVFAIVTPIKDGYLSVRLRPSSEYFAIIEKLYPELSERERREDLTPADSAKILMDKLNELGFEDYAAFMTAALGNELMSRDKHLKISEDRVILRFDQLLKVTRSLLPEAETIAEAYKESEIVPTNFRILASQLGQDGAAIGVISDNYSILSKDMNKIVEGFIASAQSVVDAINTSYFLVCTARVQREVLDFFIEENADSSGAAQEQEMRLLRNQQAEYVAKAQDSLRDVSVKCAGFRRTCLDLDRLATGLEVMRVVGKVECSNYLGVKDRVDDLLTKLESFQKTVTGALRALTRMNEQIQQEADSLRQQSERAA